MRGHFFEASGARLVTFVLAAAMLVAGQGRMDHDDGHAPESSEVVELDYACGNTFYITNSGPKPVTVTAHVVGTKEKIHARLKPAPVENPEFSELQIKTRSTGLSSSSGMENG